jgi:proteasome accessory factor A
MPRQPTDRIFGVETEFGTLVVSEEMDRPEQAVELIKEYVFDELNLGAIDLHSRDDVFEPERSGGFLRNGGRMYIDAVGSHLEYATPECRSLKDLIATDRAGQQIIVRAIRDLGFSEFVDVYNNSIDHFGGHTFGCHENYSVQATEELFNSDVNGLYAFLVTRQIFAGVGRVGGHILTTERILPDIQEVRDNPIDYIWVSRVYGVENDPTVDFQLSQRADHILKTIASRVRFNRALINPKWEHFYAHDGLTRLHLLFGESNQNQYAYALKVGTTSLVVQLMEDHLIPAGLDLHHPLIALREVSRDPKLKWIVDMADGSTMSAIDIQRMYLKACQTYAGASVQVDWILKEWESVLDGLEKDPMAMGDRIDWVAKRQILEMYKSENGLEWGDDALHSVDLEYHNIDPEKSLFSAWCQMNEVQTMCKDLDVLDAITEPPKDTRAFARGKLVDFVLAKPAQRFYMFDWNGVAVNRHYYVDLSNPFDSYHEEIEALGI